MSNIPYTHDENFIRSYNIWAFLSYSHTGICLTSPEFQVATNLPFGLMFFGKPDQVFDRDDIAFIGGDLPVVATEHLVDFAGDNAEIGLGETVFEGGESQVEAALVVAEAPGLHVIAG